jgi:hypothetical protein
MLSLSFVLLIMGQTLYSQLVTVSGKNKVCPNEESAYSVTNPVSFADFGDITNRVVLV